MTQTPASKNRVRERRLARGITQADLAEMAGISRTAVTAIEGERLIPSVKAGLAVATALATTVEELFGISQVESIVPWAWPPPSVPWRGMIAEVAGTHRIYPVEAIDRYTTLHDCVAATDGADRQEKAIASRTLVMATCDPAATLLAAMYQQATGLRILVVARSSRSALELLASGLVHVAGIHLGDQNVNVTEAAQVLAGEFLTVHAADWTEGVAVGRGISSKSVSQLKKPAVRWVGREPGSGARKCLNQLLGPKRNFPYIASDHRGVTELVRAGAADAGVCVELASAEAGLRFLSIQQEAYDLCVPAQLEEDRRIIALTDVLKSTAYRKLMSELPGYSAANSGDTQHHSRDGR